METPLVSVVIPAFNSSDYLAETLKSVSGQTWPNREIIVVDDGSTDGTAQVAQRSDVAYFYQKNQGPPAARNRGIRACRGDFIAFLDSDDVWLPEKTQRQVELLQSNPRLGFVLCRMRTRLAPGTEWPGTLQRDYYEQNPPAWVPSGMIARREVFDVVGEFHTGFPTGDDSDWFFRATDLGIEHEVLDEVLLEKTVRPGSVTSYVDDSQRSLLRQLRQSVQRKRAKADER